MAYGVTNSGFVIKRFENILDEIKNQIRLTYTDALLSDETIEGQFINIAADILSLLWEGMQDVYHASHIQFAENASLDFLMALNNIQRRSATKSRLPNAVITGASSTIIPAGFRASASNSPNIIWETISQVTVPGAGFVTTDFYCIDTGPNEINVGELDTILTPVTGITAVNNPNVTLIGSNIESDAQLLKRRNNEIANSLGGSHNGLYNAIAALNVGETLRVIEYIKIISNRTMYVVANRPPHSFEAVLTDAATYTSVSAGNGKLFHGLTSLDIVGVDLTAVYKIGDVIAVSSDYNSFGKEKFMIESIEFIVGLTRIYLNAGYKGSSTLVADTWLVDGKDIEIANAIWNAQPAGIMSYGITNITIQDIMGTNQKVSFSHPAPITIYLDLTLTVTEALTNEDKTDLKDKIVDWGNSLGIGQDVIVFGYNCVVGQLDNAKIIDVTVQIDTVFPPVAGDNNIVINDGTTTEVQYSYWNAANIRIF